MKIYNRNLGNEEKSQDDCGEELASVAGCQFLTDRWASRETEKGRGFPRDTVQGWRVQEMMSGGELVARGWMELEQLRVTESWIHR